MLCGFYLQERVQLIIFFSVLEKPLFVINVASIESGHAQACNIMLKVNLQGKHFCETQYQSRQYVFSVLEPAMIFWFSAFLWPTSSMRCCFCFSFFDPRGQTKSRNCVHFGYIFLKAMALFLAQNKGRSFK